MLTRLSNNSVRKGGREKKCRGLSVRAECQAPYSLQFCQLKNISKIYFTRAFTREQTAKR